MEQLQATRAEQRRLRLIEAEREQAIEEAEALTITEEQRQILLRPFRSVKAEFTDLDGFRWTDAALRSFPAHRPSPAHPHSAPPTPFVVCADASDDTIRVSSVTRTRNRPALPSPLSAARALPPDPAPAPARAHRDGSKPRSPVKGLFPPSPALIPSRQAPPRPPGIVPVPDYIPVDDDAALADSPLLAAPPARAHLVRSMSLSSVLGPSPPQPQLHALPRRRRTISNTSTTATTTMKTTAGGGTAPTTAGMASGHAPRAGLAPSVTALDRGTLLHAPPSGGAGVGAGADGASMSARARLAALLSHAPAPASSGSASSTSRPGAHSSSSSQSSSQAHQHQHPHSNPKSNAHSTSHSKSISNSHSKPTSHSNSKSKSNPHPNSHSKSNHHPYPRPSAPARALSPPLPTLITTPLHSSFSSSSASSTAHADSDSDAATLRPPARRARPALPPLPSLSSSAAPARAAGGGVSKGSGLRGWRAADAELDADAGPDGWADVDVDWDADVDGVPGYADAAEMGYAVASGPHCAWASDDDEGGEWDEETPRPSPDGGRGGASPSRGWIRGFA